MDRRGTVARRAVALACDPAELAALFALGLAAWVALRNASVFRSAMVDDAFITYRYADNLSSLRGFVFNPGERVEGTSALLYALVLAAAAVLRADIPTASRCLGLASFVAMVVVAYVLTRVVVRARGARFLGLIAAWLVASSTPAAYFAQSGMETTFYAALLALAIALHFARRPRAMGAFAGLAAVTRPEGAAFALMVVGLGLAGDLVARPRDGALRRALASSAVLLAILGPVVVFRLAYFGELVPNSVIAKSGFVESLRGVPPGQLARYVWDSAGAEQGREYIEYAAPLLALGCAALLLPGARNEAFTLAMVCGACLLLSVWNEGDWMGWHRLFVPSVVPVAVLAVLGLRALLFHPAQRLLSTHAPSRLVAVVVAVWLVGKVRYADAFYDPEEPSLRYLVRVGKALGKIRRDEDTLASDLVGIMPFYSRMRTFDAYGLCDRHIARYGQRHPQMGKVDDDYVMSHKPSFYMFHSENDLRVQYLGLPSFAQQRDDYLVVLTPEFLSGVKRTLIVRRDRPDLGAVRDALGGTLIPVGEWLGWSATQGGDGGSMTGGGDDEP